MERRVAKGRMLRSTSGSRLTRKTTLPHPSKSHPDFFLRARRRLRHPAASGKQSDSFMKECQSMPKHGLCHLWMLIHRRLDCVTVGCCQQQGVKVTPHTSSHCGNFSGLRSRLGPRPPRAAPVKTSLPSSCTLPTLSGCSRCPARFSGRSSTPVA